MIPINRRITRRSALKGFAIGAACSAIGDLGLETAAAARAARLPRSRPEALGVDPAGIAAFVEGVNRKVDGLHSFMLLRHGQVAAEAWWAPYAPQHPHMLFSLSKSFTSTGVGLAVAEKRLTVDTLVTSLFPDDLPSKIDENLAVMRVKHLLSMSTGHDKDATGPTRNAPDGNWVRGFLSLPVEHAPGSKFVYNSAATYMLSAIVQKLTGMTLLEYLKPRLFGPLGIQGETWESCPKGINTGGWGLSVKTEDIAKFGQLYLQKGQWSGKQIVPAEWVDEATSKHISNGAGDTSDWTQGYGYQFWRCRHGAYRGDGAFGQYCVVMPDKDAVLAITSGLGDMQAVLNVAWDTLLPAMQARSSPSASVDLKATLATLSVPPPQGVEAPSTPLSRRSFRLDSNDEKLESIDLAPERDRIRLSIRSGGKESSVVAGTREWVRGVTGLGAGFPTFSSSFSGKVAARAAWSEADTCVIKLCFYETPFIANFTCKISGDQIKLTRKMNVGFGPTERPALTGRTA